ncbi:ketopantoate reductase family protein [Streptomyces nodosus]|uniref:ketopantoate reductase family protein n=1 Tax=Streptomyces nodosus TaxID=40318 RepID=UPI003454D8A7
MSADARQAASERLERPREAQIRWRDMMVRTLFVGAGAVGGFFGGELTRAGKDVTFLVRPGRAAVLARHGLRIRYADGRTETVRPRLVTSAEIDGPFDVVVIAVKAYALEAALRDLAPAVGPDTVVVPFLNGMKHLDQLASTFEPRNVYGGVCVVSTRLGQDGEIVQLNGMQELKYGPVRNPSDARSAMVEAALSGGSFTSSLSRTILQEMWDKWVLLAAMGVITCLMRGSVGQVSSSPGGTDFAHRVVTEVTAIATAAGFAPSEAYEAFIRGVVTDPSSDLTSSMFRDLSDGAPIEVDHIVGDLLARSAELHVEAPLLALAHTHLTVYEAARAAAGNTGGFHAPAGSV